MPGFNGTGPMGEGTRTGKGQGKCRNQHLEGAIETEWKASGRGFKRHFMHSVWDDTESQGPQGFRHRKGHPFGRGWGKAHRRNNL